MKKVLLRFLFKNSGHSLDVWTTEDEALSMMKTFNLQKKYMGYDSIMERHWFVDPAEVASIFTTTEENINKQIEEAKRQQAASRAGRPSMAGM